MTDQATENHQPSPPMGVSSSEGLGPLPERDARWALAAEVASGRMAGGWVPVDADLVLALHARLTALAALERQIAEGEELDHYRRGDGQREWSYSCTWLYPGDRVEVLRAQR